MQRQIQNKDIEDPKKHGIKPLSESVAMKMYFFAI
jgi:hypothetical protein